MPTLPLQITNFVHLTKTNLSSYYNLHIYLLIKKQKNKLYKQAAVTKALFMVTNTLCYVNGLSSKYKVSNHINKIAIFIYILRTRLTLTDII